MNEEWWKQDIKAEDESTDSWWRNDIPVEEQTSSTPTDNWWKNDIAEASVKEEDASDYLMDDQVISDPELMGNIRQYMSTRKGVQYNDRPDQEVFDDWKSHMRTVEAGEVSLAGEILATNRYDDLQKEVASKAYDTWEKIAPMWEQGWGESAEAVWDYAKATINPLESPSTLLSLGMGKAITTATAKPLAMQAVKAAIKQGGKKGAQKLVRNNVIKNAVKGGLVGGALDASMAGGLDYYRQTELEMELGVREGYNPAQTAAVAALGLAIPTTLNVVGASISGKGVGITAKEAGRIRGVNQRQAQAQVGAQIQQKLAQVAQSMPPQDWKAARVAGNTFDLKESERRLLSDTFFDPSDPNSIVNILYNAGVKIDFEPGKTANNVLSYIDSLPDADRIPIEQAWEAMIGVPYKEGRDKLVSAIAESGELMGDISAANRKLSASAQAAIQQSRRLKPEDAGPQVLGYMQNLWKRMLVSNPATSSVNVQGWALADLTRQPTQVLQGLFTLAYDPKKGGRMLQHNLFDRPRLYADLYGTVDMWKDVEKNIMPSWARKQLTRETFGGVASKSPAEIYGMDNTIGRAGDKLADAASRWTFVNAQDEWTRAVSGMMELDRQTRIKYGKRFADMIKSGNESVIFKDDEIWDRVVKTSLEDTFSFDYGKGKNAFNLMARIVNQASNTPGVGLVFPFGKFMSNIIAYTARHTPLGLWNFGKYIIKKDGYEATKALSEAAVGFSAIMMLGEYSHNKMKEGFDYNQVEDSTGTIKEKSNLAPLAQGLIMGRIYEMWMNGETVPKEMYKEAGKQLAVGEFADMGNLEIFKIAEKGFEWLSAEGEEGDAAREAFGVQMGKSIGGIMSGFTRPVEPVNTILGTALESEGVTEGQTQIDRRLSRSGGEAFFLEMSRYMDQVFAPFTEDGVVGTPARSMSRPEGDIKNPNTTASLYGIKEDFPMNYTNKALGMVGLPEFKIDSRTAIPEFDRMINEVVAPLLNERFKTILQTVDFKKASQERKLDIVKSTVSQVKNAVIDDIDKGYRGTDDITLNLRKSFSTLPKVERDEALEVFDLQGTDPRDLTEYQLILLDEYMKMSRGQYKNYLNSFE